MRTCIDPDRLSEHLHGRLALDQEAQLIAHLDTCGACRATLDNLAADPRLLETARHSRRQGPADDAILAHLLKDLARRRDQSPSAATRLDCLDPPTKPGTLGRLAHYDVLEVAGYGGMSVALKTIDEKLGRLTCLKVFAHSAAIHSARARLEREARAAAAVESEHVVKVYAVDEYRGRPYLAMEYVPGRSLQEELDERGPLPIDEVLQIATDSAKGLAAAHANGLVHRDIKPGNILLQDGARRAKLTDFGMARALDAGRLTAEGCLAGTPEFMSPEQVRGELVDQRADLFGFGSVLYAMCTGRSPFAAESSLAVLRRILDDSPRAVEQVRPDVPRALADLIGRLHAKNPAARPRSANEVLELMARCNPSATRRFRVSRRIAILSFGAAVIGGGSLAMMLAWRRTDDPLQLKKELPRTIQPPALRASAHPGFYPRLLMVIAPRFDATEFYGVRHQMEQRHVMTMVASVSLDGCWPRETNALSAVKPDFLIGSARAADFDAICFCDGEGTDVYSAGGSHSDQARKLIASALAAGRIVAAMGAGPVVLAEADVLRGRPATCASHSKTAGAYVQRLETAGARWRDVPVVEDGPYITGRNPIDLQQFTDVLASRLVAQPIQRAPPKPSD